MNSAKQMLTTPRRQRLQKMFSLVGNHSAVKLCRWQKSMMRNRGGCYKWTFYGVRSHQCMEVSPSLACANKCVFCWRLNLNPTAKNWRWDHDDPVWLVDSLVEQQKKLVKNVQGMPGVTMKALTEALSPKHCALSLVGEALLYPCINRFVAELHRRKMSSFLVNNGQFPDLLRGLEPVTQLYLSVTAPSKESMRLLSRPSFPDYFDRFMESLKILSLRQERTVLRLTLIEEFNMREEDVEHYKRIFCVAQPTLIEFKRLTPAFQSRETFLRLQNVPSWNRVVEFAKCFCDQQYGEAEYGLVAAHEHSGCVLLARKELFVEGKWHTWINFDNFLSNPSEACSKGYSLPTPSWATIGSSLQGFDPQQQRLFRRKKEMCRLGTT